jgi:phosphoribosylaminoimidazole-succinocarboxamide synthase
MAHRSKKKEIYHGKHKVLYEGPGANTLVLHFKDNEASGHGTGVINNRCSEILMERMADFGVETHFIKRLNMREQLVRLLQPLPFSFSVHQVAVADFAERFDIAPGACFSEPVIELLYKASKGDDVVISAQHATGFGWISDEDMEKLYCLVLRMSDFLSGYFSAHNLKLSQTKFRFGRTDEDSFVLIDEISPQTCSWVEMSTGFFLDMNLENTSIHHIIADRLSLFPKNTLKDVCDAA